MNLKAVQHGLLLTLEQRIVYRASVPSGFLKCEGDFPGTQDKPGLMVKQKAGLNREILSAGLSMAHNMLAYKAIEA